MKAWIAFFSLAVAGSEASAQTIIKVAESAWNALATEERYAIQKRHVVELAVPDAFGTIIDNQGINESTQGSTAGAQLGAATADAIYLDKAFRSPNWNYSAKENLGYVLLGAVIGSAFDRPAVAQFRFRYAVRLGSGDVRYYEETKSDAFRHPVGVCVTVPNINITDQALCTQDANSLREKYLGTALLQTSPATQPSTSATAGPAPSMVSPNSVTSGTDFVMCRFGALAPIRTTAEKCWLTGGTQER